MILKEGGNVFRDSKGNALTQRINQTDIGTTVEWLEQLTNLDLRGDLDPKTRYPEKWLGSTGKKPSSGDLDLAVDSTKVSKEQLASHLTSWAQSQKLKPEEYIKKTGNSVHFKTPINGNPDKGYVQTDFMFVNKPKWSSFMLSAPSNSEYRGQDRNILINSIAKALGYKLNQNDGIMDRATNNLITDDINKAAQLLLNKSSTIDDLYSVETIIQALQNDPKRDEKLKDAREHFSRAGVPFFETRGESDINFLARLRDRIVNQGMQVIVEEKKLLNEADARIEHLEDLVFEKGSRGIEEAIEIVKQAAENTGQTVTVKWDGKPAIIWGRKPDGTFVLTDKAGFTAKGYDGLATSPQQIAQIQQQRGGDRGELIELYAKLFPMLKATTPPNFKGYVKGDLLFGQQPPEISGAYVFKPNVIEYKIPVNSVLGQRIASSDVGVAVHTKIAEPGAAEQAIGRIKFNEVPGLLLIEPSVKDIKNVQAENKIIKQLKDIVAQHGANINTLFNPTELRAAQISDLPALCKRYINSRITSNFENLLPDFGKWLEQNVTPRKFKNIVEYVQSPRSNTDGMAAAFTAFLLLHDLKMDMLRQLDVQQPGQEGWVVATDSGRAKLVNRFGFSAANREFNRPKP